MAMEMTPHQHAFLVKYILVGKAGFPLSGSIRPIPSAVHNKPYQSWFILNMVLKADSTFVEPPVRTLTQIKIYLNRLDVRNIPLVL